METSEKIIVKLCESMENELDIIWMTAPGGVPENTAKQYEATADTYIQVIKWFASEKLADAVKKVETSIRDVPIAEKLPGQRMMRLEVLKERAIFNAMNNTFIRCSKIIDNEQGEYIND